MQLCSISNFDSIKLLSSLVILKQLLENLKLLIACYILRGTQIDQESISVLIAAFRDSNNTPGHDTNIY